MSNCEKKESSCEKLFSLKAPLINIQCGQSSFIRNVNLVPQLLRLQNQQIPTTCTYKIHAVSGFICQMRFDFVEFNLAPPTVSPYPRCTDEFMTVGNVTLCGVNNGQHSMYLFSNHTSLMTKGKLIFNAPYSLRANQSTER